MSRAPEKQMVPWGRALSLGLLGALAIGLLSPLWALGQMGGPSPFGYVLFFVFSAVLVLSVFVVKPRSMTAAIQCGLLLSVPVACFCWIFPKVLPGVDYFKEIPGEGIAVIVVSVLVTVLARFQRQLSLDAVGRSAEPAAPPSDGPAAGLDNSEDGGGPPSVS